MKHQKPVNPTQIISILSVTLNRYSLQIYSLEESALCQSKLNHVSKFITMFESI